jgi:methionyl-tRNA formyltransferase
LPGKEEAVVSIMKIDEKMDHGPLVTQFKEDIEEDETVESLRARLFDHERAFVRQNK